MKSTLNYQNCIRKLKPLSVYTSLPLIIFIISISFYFIKINVDASINEAINVQGRISNTDGTNLVTGSPACLLSGADSCDFQIRIYDSATSGALLWEENFTNIEIGNYNGVFSLNLGEGTATGGFSDLGTDVDFSNPNLFVEIEFDPSGNADFSENEIFLDTTGNRYQFSAVPYAFNAKNAENLNGLNSSGFVQIAPSSAQTTGDVSNAIININEDGVGAPDLLNLAVDGTSKVVISNDGDVRIGDSLYFGSDNSESVVDAGTELRFYASVNERFRIDGNGNLFQFGGEFINSVTWNIVSQGGLAGASNRNNSIVINSVGGGESSIWAMGVYYGDNQFANRRFGVRGDGRTIIGNIGSNFPAGMLEIKPPNASDIGLVISGVSSQTGDYVNINSDGNTGGNIFAIESSGAVGIGTTNVASIYKFQVATPTDTETFIIGNSGRIGINTTSLGAALTIDGANGDNSQRAIVFTGGTGTIYNVSNLNDGSYTGAFQLYSTNIRVNGYNGGGLLNLSSPTASTTPIVIRSAVGQTSSLMSFLDSSGNEIFGVSPQGGFRVHDSNDSSIIPYYFQHSVVNPFAVDGVGVSINMQSEQGNGVLLDTAILKSWFSDASSVSEDSVFTIDTTSNGSTSEKLRIDETGNIGIGNSNPDRKLDVDGNWGGNVVVDERSLTNDTTVNKSTKALAYHLSNDSGTTNANVTITFNITGLPDTDGTFAFIYTSVTKGITALPYTSTVKIQINGNDVSQVTTGTSTITGASGKEMYIITRTNGIWHLATGTSATDNANADLAEWIKYSNEIPVPGQIVSIADTTEITVEKSTKNSDSKMAGVVATNPNMVMGPESRDAIWLALSGRVPTMVIVRDGIVINHGDYITSSTVPGFGQKLYGQGPVVGKSLESTSNWNETTCTEIDQVENIPWPADQGLSSIDNCYKLPDGSYAGKVMVLVGLSWGHSADLNGNLGLIDLPYNPNANNNDDLDDVLTDSNSNGNINEVLFGQQVDAYLLNSRVTIQSIDVSESSVFRDDVQIKGVTMFSGNNLGQAMILEGDDVVEVVFEDRYRFEPIVNVTPVGENILNLNFKYTIINKTKRGFMIKLDQEAPEDIVFDWMSFGVDDGNIFLSNGRKESLDESYFDGSMEIDIDDGSQVPDDNSSPDPVGEPVETGSGSNLI